MQNMKRSKKVNKLKLNRDNYFSAEANWRYMSVSQYKDFLKCEAAALAKLKGEYEPNKSDAFLAGSYVHAWNEGILEEFKASNPGLYSSRGSSKGQLKSEFKNLDLAIETLANDRLAMMALEGEKEVVMTSELFGVPWKIMIDSYNPSKGRFTDLKTVKSLEDKFWNGTSYESFIEHYRYTTQIAVYSEVERLVSGRDSYLEGLIVAVTKETPPDKAVIGFDTDMIELELLLIEDRLPRIIEVKQGKTESKGCGKCEYCRSKKKLTGIIHYRDLLI